ncbi:MAG: DNA primase [Treponema sp.]|nr:DNA primase [Treponema sp.]
MPLISKKSIDEVTSRADIVSVVGEYLPLTQRGSAWWGCCPFHNEKTPSFTVNEDKKLYYCFGCHKGGNVIKFVQEMEKLDFAAAVELLAKKAGVRLEYEDGGSLAHKDDSGRKLKEEYIELYTRVSTSFHYMLMETEAGRFALDYIKSRGLTSETIEKFKLGYSPSDRRWLYAFLRKKNYSEEFLDASGLFSKNYKGYAFFADRLMFPIFNRNGSVVAMGGRFLRGDAEKSPKYLNSGDLIQYKKGETLYAFNFAKDEIRKNKKVIFCEGYMDCIAYHQCGILYAVAPLGTALTDEQIKMVKPFAGTILLSFDSDGAGQQATRRAILMCRSKDLEVRVIQLSGGKDPAEIMLKFGAKTLTDDVNSAILDCDFLLNRLRVLYPKGNPEDKAQASLDFFEYVDCLQSNVRKEECLKLFSQTFEIELEALRKDYTDRSRLSRRMVKKEMGQDRGTAGAPVAFSAEIQAVATAVSDDGKLFRMMRDQVSSDDLEDPQARELFVIMEQCSANDNFSVNSILNRCDDENLKDFIVNSIRQFSDYAEDSVRDATKRIKLGSLRRKEIVLQEQIQTLSRSSLDEDRKKVSQLLEEKMDVARQINLLK